MKEIHKRITEAAAGTYNGAIVKMADAICDALDELEKRCNEKLTPSIPDRTVKTGSNNIRKKIKSPAPETDEAE